MPGKFWSRYPVLFYLLLLVGLLVPTFWTLLKFGIFSMHDFHLFRFYEYERCMVDLQIPCRWSPDVAFKYGQPLFNFYGQLPYLLGEAFRLLRFSMVDSLKGLFISSLVLSALGMFVLSRQIWNNNLAALVSALVYVYAPYRAVDIYVRGALPEAVAFIFFPLITFFFNDHVLTKKTGSLLLFSLTFAMLILTHNLSALMYLFFLVIWGVYLLTREKAWSLLPKFALSGLMAGGLAAFYLLPVAGESNLVTMQKMIGGYYDYNIHFVTLKQLLISRVWGYGASMWGENDGLSLSVGHVQWILPLLITGLILLQRRLRRFHQFFVLLLTGWVMLWLTHNKSVPVWHIITSLHYLQFPWRFLSMAIFAFALSSGAVILVLRYRYARFGATTLIIAALLALNTGFFMEDLWYKVTDREQFSGIKFDEQTASSVNDYWPIYGSKTPTKVGSRDPTILSGKGETRLIKKTSSQADYEINITSSLAEAQIPIVYFPGWIGTVNSRPLEIYPNGELGLITAQLPPGKNLVQLKFINTPIRRVGNLISLASIIGLIFLALRLRKEQGVKT